RCFIRNTSAAHTDSRCCIDRLNPPTTFGNVESRCLWRELSGVAADRRTIDTERIGFCPTPIVRPVHKHGV
ncbi:hypothetical protein, partial [Caballeronia grimmiae]|uniref:hypothetical protein n=1 Tax=Caballeronia grimmiae TaxID=1071679 RepID=UPI0038BC4F58